MTEKTTQVPPPKPAAPIIAAMNKVPIFPNLKKSKPRYKRKMHLI